MNFLEEKILKDGVIKKGNVLKIDNFLNHQIDINIIRQIASELKRRFHEAQVNKILTIEASGIAIATMLGNLYDVPVVFAKKGETVNSTDDKYMSQAYSFTHKKMNNVFVSKPYLQPTRASMWNPLPSSRKWMMRNSPSAFLSNMSPLNGKLIIVYDEHER